ncbi:hypothetical protein CR513_50391, partial [Mucuna pruriens]
MEDDTNRMMSLNDTNYHLWKGKMKYLLFVKKMHLPIFGTQKPKSIILWENIESLYASKCGKNKLFLLNSIVSLKFKEDTSLSDHLNEFQGILDQMSGMDIKFKDEILCLSLKIRGEIRKKGREKSRSKSKSRYKNVEYHYCYKKWHIQKYYLLWKRRINEKRVSQKRRIIMIDDDRVTIATGDDLVILRDFESINLVFE